MSELALLTGADSKSNKLYVDDVFSAYTYTGNDATQTINNGIDLAGKGGLVWIKSRTSAAGHALFDTDRGVNIFTGSSETAPDNNYPNSNTLTNFNTSGFSLGSDATWGRVNLSSNNHASWTFRKAPKFFDIVTYTGTGAAKNIAHGLGAVPGCIIVKATNSAGWNWTVYHRSVSATAALYLNTSVAASTSAGPWNNTEPTSNLFSIGTTGSVNESGTTYVAYLFAHDDSADSIVKCGSFTTDASGNATVDLGWEPQFSLVKAASSTGDWWINDVVRTWDNNGIRNLYANSPVAETAYIATTANKPTATGFVYSNNASTTYIYMAIRRSNKPPALGTEVYKAIGYTATNTQNRTINGAGFPPDMALGHPRIPTGAVGHFIYSRLTNRALNTSNTSAESNYTPEGNFTQDGMITDGVYGWMNEGTTARQLHFFKRAVGVFDVVCYTLPIQATTAIQHNLNAIPELIIVKARTTTTNWHVRSLNLNLFSRLDTTQAFGGGPSISNESATSFTVSGANGELSQANFPYVAYLFASKAGISKVFSYTGNGSSQTIDCGFTTGARFVMIKRTDSTGDWYIWDSVRGIVASNDSHLSLNTTAAEVTTDDSVDPNVLGFIVNQVAATNINVSAGTYIGLAFA